MRARPSWGAILGVVVFGAGFVLGTRSLWDNSFLTHLATGRVILDTGSVPSHDPYTATAAGEPWVVQSWLMSVVYASAEAIGGLDLIRVLTGLLMGTVALIGWRLLRPIESVVARLAVVALFLVACAQSWSERPLMVGLVAIGIVALTVEERWDPRWLLPLGWIWANTHGSHPLGVVYLLLIVVGARFDSVDARRELRALGWLAAGIVVGVIGPLGLQALLFPLDLLSRREVLSGVVEWRAPTFDVIGQQAFLGVIALAVVTLARQPSYRRSLVLAVFGVAAIMSLRNLPVAMIVLLPGIAGGIGSVGSLRSSDRPAIGRAAIVAAVLGCAVLGSARLQGDALDLRRYPVQALARWEQEGRPGLLVTKDFVGNLQSYVYGADAASFYDDRFDMFPAELTEQYRAIAPAAPGASQALADLGSDAVLWERDEPIVTTLVASPDWRLAYLDDRWALLCRRGGDGC